MKRLHTRSIAALLCLGAALSVYASPPSAAVPSGFVESAGIRTKMAESCLSADPSSVLGLKDELCMESGVHPFSFSVSQSADRSTLEVSFSPLYASGRQGTWILERDLRSGEPLGIVVYPVPDPEVKVIIAPGAAGRTETDSISRLTLEIHGLPLVRDIPVGIPFSSVFTRPFEHIVSLTASAVPWHLLRPVGADYRDMASAVETLRERLPSLVYLDDGAFDHDGNPVFIASGEPQTPTDILKALPEGSLPGALEGGVNCSGFAKWVVDGAIKPITGSNTRIDALKGETSSPKTHFTEPFRDSRDLYFGLNWTRHLASAAVSARLRRTKLPSNSGVDVTVEPFSASSGYQEAVGYKVSELMPYLYYLAASEGGHFYLGAISRERGEPLLRQYHHIALFFPWFDDAGAFHVAVFESAVETPPEKFVSANSDAWVHLVRVRAPQTGYFWP